MPESEVMPQAVPTAIAPNMLLPLLLELSPDQQQLAIALLGALAPGSVSLKPADGGVAVNVNLNINVEVHVHAAPRQPPIDATNDADLRRLAKKLVRPMGEELSAFLKAKGVRPSD